VRHVPVISLFSGAGGMDLGIEDAGADVRVMVEPNPDCVATLRENGRFYRSARIISQPLEGVSTDEILATAGLRKREAALLIGGPPCQPFSKSGYWLQDRRPGLTDERVDLVREFLRVIRETLPEGFILENVAGLTHPTHRTLFEEFLSVSRSYGYTVDWRLLHAVEYGVPQTRSRVFAIGLRGKHAPTFPPITHEWQPHANGNGSQRLLPAETAGRWIANLDQNELFEPQELIKGRWARALRTIPPGWNYKFRTEWAGHRRPLFVTETKYWTFLLKLHPRRPSWTIQASAGPWTGPFHWDNRRLRVPELAALQTFPTTYVFSGSRKSRMRQIGNAVPPVLASRVAAAVLKEIAGFPAKSGRSLRFKLADGHWIDLNLTQHRGPRW
jgi:DNA (cytosine-5)-methyltransferase 1